MWHLTRMDLPDTISKGLSRITAYMEIRCSYRVEKCCAIDLMQLTSLDQDIKVIVELPSQELSRCSTQI